MKTQNNKLYIGEIEAEELVKKYGSPLYVYEEETIRQRFRELKEAIPCKNLKIFYACKANTNPEIMKTLREEGSCVDAISPGEMMIALKAGFKPEQILFTSTSVKDEEMRLAIEKKILVNCDSLSQLERYGRINPNSKVCVRINPDVGAGHHGHVITGGADSKFGIYYDKVPEIKAIAKKYSLKIIGIHQHIGSGILEQDKFIQAMGMLLKTAKQFENLEFVDFGGGLGIPYKPEQKRLDIKGLGKRIAETFTAFCREYGKELMLYIEPGRYPVAEAGFLLCTVNTIKETPKHKFAGVDTGFNHLVRPAMYGSYHSIINASNVESAKKQKIAIAGNVCESGDVFTRDEHGILDREMPEIKEGDVLAILNAGAYGYSMSSNYNSRQKPAEVLVKGKVSRVIRKMETFEHMMEGTE